MEPGRWTIDVTDQSFAAEVIERSKRTPVVVDFWAPWCAPCRTLGPLLERLAEKHGGAFVLARVDVDQNPAVARAAGVQSIPLVLAVRDGKVVSEFVGAQPAEAVEQFVAALLPDEAERLVDEAQALTAGGDAAAAEALLRRVLAERAAHPRASSALARLLDASGRTDEALALLETAAARASAEQAQEIQALLAELRTRVAPIADGDEAVLRERIAADPADLQARLDLGRLLAAARRYEDALGELLEVVRRDRVFADDAARKAMIDVFTVLGRDHPVADRFQRELSSVLFR